jgi:hypothetical protein
MELLEAFDLVRCVHSAAELAEVDENTVTRHRLRAFGTKRSWLDRPEACVATGTLVPRRPARPRPNRGAFTWRVGRMTQASNSEPWSSKLRLRSFRSGSAMASRPLSSRSRWSQRRLIRFRPTSHLHHRLTSPGDIRGDEARR